MSRELKAEIMFVLGCFALIAAVLIFMFVMITVIMPIFHHYENWFSSLMHWG